jgi:hypothetical protein
MAQFLRGLNDFPGWIFGKRVKAGLFNRGTTEIPDDVNLYSGSGSTAESITTGGNIGRVIDNTNPNAVQVECIIAASGNAVPDVNAVNYFNTPHLVAQATSTNGSGAIGKWGGLDFFIPQFAKTHLWVPRHQVEFFPSLPMTVSADLAGVNIFETFDGVSQIIGRYSMGDRLEVVQYRPVGSDVWGRTKDGWICLACTTAGGTLYFTTWRMQTAPPPSPTNATKERYGLVPQSSYRFVNPMTPAEPAPLPIPDPSDSPSEGHTTMKIGFQIWQWYNYPIKTLVDWAKLCGLDWVSVKGGEGPWLYGHPDDQQSLREMKLRALRDAFTNEGIEFGVWAWLYGQSPEKEADIAKQIFDVLNPAFYQLNIEANASPPNYWNDVSLSSFSAIQTRSRDAARRLMTRLWTNGLHGKEFHLNSHRYMRYHQMMGWDLFLKPQRWGFLADHVNIISHHAPQVIHAWNTSVSPAAAELRASHQEFSNFSPLPFAAMGTAHEWAVNGKKWLPSAQDFTDFINQAQALQCERVGWFKLEHLIDNNRTDWAAAIRGAELPEPEPTPQPEPEPDPTVPGPVEPPSTPSEDWNAALDAVAEAVDSLRR